MYEILTNKELSHTVNGFNIFETHVFLGQLSIQANNNVPVDIVKALVFIG